MDKSLRKLSRMELLQLLLEASEMNEALVTENTELKRALTAAHSRIAELEAAQQRQAAAMQQARVEEQASPDVLPADGPFAYVQPEGHMQPAMQAQLEAPAQPEAPGTPMQPEGQMPVGAEQAAEAGFEAGEIAGSETAQAHAGQAEPDGGPSQPDRAAEQAEAVALPRTAKVGSIAEAALQANGYFEAAQRSADDYLREIKRLRDQMAARAANQDELQRRAKEQALEHIQSQAEAYIQDVQNRADAIVAQANEQAEAISMDAKTQWGSIVADARSQADAIIADANRQAAELVERATLAPATSQPAPAAEPGQGAQGAPEPAPAPQPAGRVDSAWAPRDTGTADMYATGPIMRRGRHVKLPDDLRTS